MQRITLSDHKHEIVTFEAESIDFQQHERGLLLTAEGVILFQETAMVEEYINGHHECQVTIEKDGETVINDRFVVTIFSLEADQLVALLSS